MAETALSDEPEVNTSSTDPILLEGTDEYMIRNKVVSTAKEQTVRKVRALSYLRPPPYFHYFLR